MFSIRNLNKTFKGKHILKDVSLSVDRGDIAILLGGSGVGKSTLLRILNNLEQPDSGSILFNGNPLPLDTIQKSHLIGMVFQHFNLFAHLTVERNITLALEKVLGKTQAEAHEIATELLARYGLQDKAQEPVSSLSGGQKQRLSIARALALKPQLLCMDEPTSALDPLLTDYVAQQIQDLAHQGYSLIIATHDMKLLEKLRCTIYLMDHGEIVEMANSVDLAAHPEKFMHIKSFIQG